MKKKTIELIYACIFILSVLLYVFSMWRYIVESSEWFTFTLSLGIMFLSLWGYLIVKKYLKMK